MGELKSSRYDSTIAEKANTPFAKRFRDLVSDAKTANDLKDYLGITIQAINQYKQGTAYPKTENLIKIADYFSISVDYLLGLSNTPSRKEDIQAACKTTGLSTLAIEWLRSLVDKPNDLGNLNAVLENKTFQAALPFIEELKNVQIAAEMNNMFEAPAREVGYGEYLVGGCEYLSVLEYRISKYLEIVIDEVTRRSLDELGG